MIDSAVHGLPQTAETAAVVSGHIELVRASETIDHDLACQRKRRALSKATRSDRLQAQVSNPPLLQRALLLSEFA